ncbi:serine acetyltransferase [Shewanella sp. 5_MG-2023]|uniref:serine O-acetyltransferase n=1 Tax=Shewanella sp. 5_MG-2023 TaxID=3062656 RepID=UPI0026E48293|nr:serine acetyltransferase [Shewanella sp. 5_MG-2023]MDO6639186.1 serine acetyltransferase [Shewanella sp. 5_MG-2023]
MKVVKLLFPFMFHSEKIIFLHRIGAFFYEKNYLRLSLFIEGIILTFFSCAISSQAKIGNNFKLPHPLGVVIGAGCIIGNNVSIYQNVTLGRKSHDLPLYPQLLNNIIIYPNSVVLGDVTIHDNAIVGACSLVINHIDKDSINVGSPSKRIR